MLNINYDDDDDARICRSLWSYPTSLITWLVFQGLGLNSFIFKLGKQL